MTSELFAIVAPVFLLAALGYVWVRMKQPFDAVFASALVINLGTPFLTFSSLTRLHLKPLEFLQIAGSAGAVLATVGLMSVAVLKLMKLPLPDYLPALMFGNSGNMGLPLSLFAFGDHGLALAVGYFAATSMVNMTFGQWIASRKPAGRLLLRSPVVYGVLASLAFMLTETPVPRWLDNTAYLLGGFTIPPMLLMLGVSIAQLRITMAHRAVLMALLRLGLGFAAGWVTAWALGLEGAARGVAILQATMPVGVVNYVFARQYGNDHETVAGAVIVSTLLSFAILPPLLLYLLP